MSAINDVKKYFAEQKAFIPAGDFTKAGRLRSMLIADSNRGVLRNQESGRVDRGRLANLVAGDSRVFKRKHPRQDTNTFVQICVDASYSMNRGLTTQALIVLDSVFRGTQIKHEIIAWCGGDKCRKGDFSFRMSQLRSPNDPPSKDWTIGAYAVVHGGCTPTAGALPICANRLIEQRDCRKVMIFVSDGDPNLKEEVPECRKIVTEVLPKCGVEVFGISIGRRSKLEQIIPMCGHAKTFGDFTDVLLDTAKRALL